MEATLDQSTSSVMNAFLRFIDMRGLPNEFLSDNRKSFTSLNKELKSWVWDLDKGLIIRHAYNTVIWRFTPPCIYETMVEATKRAFHVLYVEEDLNMDKFCTAVS